MPSGAASPASSGVSLKDVVQHMLLSVQDAAKHDNAKLCRALVQSLIKEILAGSSDEASKSRRAAVEHGVVQTLVGVVWQFSVTGSERDITARLHLVVVCLDVILELRPFVRLDTETSVPICVLLRASGVRKLVKSMEQHWVLRNRSVPLLSKYMRVLLHVAACEQGTRMLLAAGVHTLILGILTPKIVSDKHAILIMLRIVSQIVFHQPSARATFWTHSAVRTILYYGTSAGENNFAVHVEVTSLLCMVSTEQRGAEAILACDPLGYAIKVLHDASLAAPTSALTSGDFEAATALQQELESNTSHESQDYSASMPAKLDVGRGKTPPQGNSPASAPSPPPSPPLTGYAIENLNNTARNAMSVGTQLFSNLIRRPSVSSTTQSSSQSSHSATKLSEEGARSATWAAMLMHNLCASVKDNATMKMVICEAYEANTLTLKTEWHDRPVFQRVSSLMQRLLASSLEEEEQNEPKQNCDKTMSRGLCPDAASPSEEVDLLDFASTQDRRDEQQKQTQHEDGQEDNDEKSPCSRPVSPENIKSEIVATILGTGLKEDAWIGDETIETPSLGGLGGLAVLFNISYLEEVYSIRLKEILDVLLQHYTTSLVEPEMLPIPVEGSRVLNFIFALMTHPALQERIKRDSIQQEVADFVSITRDLCDVEFSRGVDRAFSVIFDEEKKAVRVLPSILYASFWVGAELGSSSDPLAAGSSSAEEQQTRQALGSPAAASVGSPLNSALHVDTSAAPAPLENPRKSSIAGLSPTRFGIGDLNANGTSRRKRRQSQNPYTPSISHVALSENTNLIDLDQDTNTAPASSSIEVSRDDTLSLASWLDEPHILAVQISLRMEKLYLFTDPSRLVLYALAPDKLENRIQKCPAEHAFLQEYDKLVFWFKDQILAGETSFSRAGVVEGVIDIAICAASDMLQNAALVLACIEALSSSPIRRLEVTWRNVGAKKWERFENLKRLCGVDDDTVSAVEVKSPKAQTASGGTSTGSPQGTKPNDTKADALEFALAGAQPSFFLANARIPYLNGVIVALRFQAKKAKAASQLPPPPQLKESNLGASSEDDLLAFGSELLPSPKLGARQRSASLDAFDPLGLFGSQDLPSANDIPRGSRLCAQYKILSSWIGTIQPNGNWQPRLYAHQPEVPLQIALKELQLPTPNQVEAMTARSVRQEPLWALNQMLLESSYAIESWIESLFDSQVEEEGKVLRTFRATVSNQDYLPKSAPLNGGRIQSAAAQIFRTAEPLASTDKETSVLDSLPRVPVVATGKLVDSLVREISGKRRARLLQESGSRSAEHWEKLVAHVRLTVERIVLSPLLSRMLLGAMRDNIRPECTLQEKSLYLRSLDHKELVKLLGLPQRKGLSECRWKGAVAALQSFDDVDMPSLKLRILLRVKDSIFSEAASLQVMDMNADEFLPVMTYVLLQAELRHPYATTKLLRELLSDDFVSGETAYYLTTLEIALGSLLEISIPSSATSEVASLLVEAES